MAKQEVPRQVERETLEPTFTVTASLEAKDRMVAWGVKFEGNKLSIGNELVGDLETTQSLVIQNKGNGLQIIETDNRGLHIYEGDTPKELYDNMNYLGTLYCLQNGLVTDPSARKSLTAKLDQLEKQYPHFRDQSNEYIVSFENDAQQIMEAWEVEFKRNRIWIGGIDTGKSFNGARSVTVEKSGEGLKVTELTLDDRANVYEWENRAAFVAEINSAR